MDEEKSASNRAIALYNEGVAWLQKEQLEKAHQCFCQSWDLFPTAAAAANIFFSLHHLRRFTEAINFGEAIFADRSWPPAIAGTIGAALATFLLQAGESRRAAYHARRVAILPIDIQDRIRALTTVLVAGIHSDRCGFPDHLADCIAYHQLSGTYEPSPRFDFDHLPRSAMRLNIGYCPSANRQLPDEVFTPIHNHNLMKFGVFVYQDVTKLDPSRWFTSRAANVTVRNWVNASDDEKAESIYRDNINVLVDLTPYPHFLGGRFMAQKPAPLIVAFFDKFVSTGSKCYDYFFTDSYLSPPEDAQYFLEKLYWLSHPIIQPLRLVSTKGAPEPPVLARGFVTFGCVGRVEKVTEDYIAACAEIMELVPGSRLWFCNRGWDAPGTRDRVLRLAQARGIADRIEIHGNVSYEEFAAQYDSIDILLDTFPFSGGTTTMEALWRGVPVVAHCVPTGAGRISAAFLHILKLSELVASDPAEFVRLAAELARDTSRLSLYRATLHGRLARDLDGTDLRLARALEAAYREIWTQWSAANPVIPRGLQRLR